MENDIQFILAHPNGWGGEEQTLMRSAMIAGGLIDNDDHERVTFVTEGEASLHFCLNKGLNAFATVSV